MNPPMMNKLLFSLGSWSAFELSVQVQSLFFYNDNTSLISVLYFCNAIFRSYIIIWLCNATWDI